MLSGLLAVRLIDGPIQRAAFLAVGAARPQRTRLACRRRRLIDVHAGDEGAATIGERHATRAGGPVHRWIIGKILLAKAGTGGEARHERVEIGSGPHCGAIDDERFAPHQARVLAEAHHVVEEAREDGQVPPLADAGEAGVIGQRLVQSVAQILAVGQLAAGAGGLNERALRVQAFNEENAAA